MCGKFKNNSISQSFSFHSPCFSFCVLTKLIKFNWKDFSGTFFSWKTFLWYSKLFSLILWYACKKPKAESWKLSIFQFFIHEEKRFGTIWRHNKTMNKFYCGKKEREPNETRAIKTRSAWKKNAQTNVFNMQQTDKSTQAWKVFFFLVGFSTHTTQTVMKRMKVVLPKKSGRKFV